MLLLLLASFVSIARCVDAADVDCNQMAGFCQFGNCKTDGVCGCQRGFRGASCSLYPPKLIAGFVVPGQVDSESTEAFYIVPDEDLSTSTTVEINVVGGGGALNVYAAIGAVPTAQQFQWSYPDSQRIVVEPDSLDPAPFAIPNALPHLFVVIQAKDGPKSKVPFSIKRSGGSLVAGLENWQFGLIIGGSVLCCCCCVGIVAFVIFKAVGGGGNKKKSNNNKNKNNDQQALMMQPMQQPVMQPGYNLGDANANDMTSVRNSNLNGPMMGNTMMMMNNNNNMMMMNNNGISPVYNQQNFMGGGTPDGSVGGSYNLGGPAAQTMQGGYPSGSAASFESAQLVRGYGGGAMNVNVADGYHMDASTQAAW